MQRASAETAEQDGLVVDDEADLPACLLDPCPRGEEALIQVAGGDICPRVRAGSVIAGVVALEREPG